MAKVKLENITKSYGQAQVIHGIDLGDTSTLADPAVVDDLIANRQNWTGGGA
ncbi:hypothetical protein [Rhizobium leguminosarum]|uniref:hypothetical protein n=1 Tax=Rhizobium leguminosarum TaxID=384 RepID=UPI0015BED193|nr:hypothetical protein [Rhizobium leguminosarum]MBY5825918.1 hypothetical protein [Rhizobium leguminosarum]